MAIDYTKLLKKIVPAEDGEDVLKLRVGAVAAIASDGSVDVTLSGVTVPDVPVLSGAHFAVGTIVQMLSYRGSLMVIGGAGALASLPAIATGGTTSGQVSQAPFSNSLASTGIHGVAFIGPPSGIVMVMGRAVGGSQTAGQYTVMDFEVKNGSVVGSGSSFRGPQEAQASVFQSSTANQQGTLVTSGLVTGLTPGAAYNAALTYHTTGSPPATSDINRRHIMVLPQ